MDVHQSRKSSNLQARRRIARSKNNESMHGFESDVVQAPKMPTANVSGRRVWTFKGTTAPPKRTTSNRPTGRRTTTGNSSRRTSSSTKPKRTASIAKLTRSIETPLFKEPERISRSRSKSTHRTNSQLSQQDSVRSKSTLRSCNQGGSVRSKSRASSAASSIADSVTSVNSVNINPSLSKEDGLLTASEERIREDATFNRQLNSETSNTAQKPSYRDSSPNPILPSEEVVVGRLKQPDSPCVTSYRKIVYNEKENKWVEYEKLCENEDFYIDRMRREQGIALPPPRSPLIEKPHRIKGRTTERLQLMFPTALVLDKRHREYPEKLKMTDQLRLELYKRHVQVVPTHFQKHILKYGKLPFRNNPRPHLIV